MEKSCILKGSLDETTASEKKSEQSPFYRCIDSINIIGRSRETMKIKETNSEVSVLMSQYFKAYHYVNIISSERNNNQNRLP